jgi:hypothetical protein
MRKAFLFLSFSLLLLCGCKRLFYKEYRNKDYYELSEGRHLFFDRNKLQEIPVSKGIYKSAESDTCSCLYRVDKASSRYCFSDLIIGMHLDIHVHSRDFYGAFPRDGSIEKIKSIKFILSGKGPDADLSPYLKEQVPLRDKMVFFSTDSIPTVPPADYVLYDRNPRCFTEYPQKDLRSFIQNYNSRKFDDGLNTIDNFYFFFSVSPACPYNIRDYKLLSTEILLVAGKHERKLFFSTSLDRTTIPE